MRIQPTGWLLALLLLTSSQFSGCGSPQLDHYSAALAIERELLRSNPETDYSDRRYLAVMRELDRVPTRSSTRDKADALWQRISDGRRFALNEKLPDQVDHLPDRLAGRDAPKPPRFQRSRPTRKSRSAGSPTDTVAPAPSRSNKTNAASPAPAPEALARLDITMYSTSWCGYCRKARSWLNSRGYPFVEKNIEKDPVAHKEYMVAGKGYRGVPLIVVNGKSFRGFNKRSVKRSIEQVLAED